MLIHGILLENMIHAPMNGVNGVAQNLLYSYLSQRQQVVDFNGFISDTL